MEAFRYAGNHSNAGWLLLLWSVMIIAYKYGKLSVLQPMLSLNYVLSIFLAAVVLKEQITLLKSIGVLIIIAGVILIAGGDEE